MKIFLMQTSALALIRLMMDLLLPDGEAKRYADLGAGLCLMLCMLNALQGLMALFQMP
ncbi:MAG: hypothetical protein IJB69_05605 [Clostridia bacterium]|nr:hypothetical protein [Clostridia bacterium]